MESGYTITVTPKMRAAIAIKLREMGVQENIAGFSSGEGKGTYVVPARPLLSAAFDNPKVGRTLQQNWIRALEDSFKKQGAKGGEHRNK